MLLSVAQVAARLGVPRSIVNEWVGRGLFPGTERVGRVWVIPEAALEHFTPPDTTPTIPEGMLTKHQAAARLNATVEMIQVWIHKGRFPGARLVDRKWLIPEADVAAFTRRRPGPRREAAPAGMLTTPQAAQQLGVSISTVQSWATRGLLTGAKRRGRAWVIPQQTVDDFRPPRNERQRAAFLGAADRQRYREILQSMGLGAAAEAALTDGETREQVLRDLRQAAAEIGYEIVPVRSNHPRRVRFYTVKGEAAASAASPDDDTATGDKPAMVGVG